MIEIGLGLPGQSVADIRASAEAAAPYAFDSFSIYGDLGDLPPYAVLHATADTLRGSQIDHIGPLGVPVSMTHPEVIVTHAMALDEQLPGQTSIGLVRGAFLEAINKQPASLGEVASAVHHIRQRFGALGHETPPIYLGGFGPKALRMAGRLAVQGVKLGGSTNPALAEHARAVISNASVDIVLGAVSVIDKDRQAARALARQEVAKYLAVVGSLDPTLDEDDHESLQRFNDAYIRNEPDAPNQISDTLLDKFSLAGTPEDALAALQQMNRAGVNRFEFGTPQGLRHRPDAIRYIAQTVLGNL